MNETKRTFPRLLAVSGAVLAIAGCGGGSSTTPAPTPVVNAMSGTAAVGSPIAGGTVKVICAAGAANASTTTTASGTWQTSVTGQTLPCAVQVSGGTIKGAANPTALHAFTTGFGTVNITSLTTELITRVLFTDGQRVSAGTPLVELQAREEDAGIIEARAQVAQAQRQFDRYKTLADRGIAPRVSAEDAETALATAQASLTAAQARRGDRLIRAPFAGVLGLSSVTAGTLVNPGGIITTLDDIDVVDVAFLQAGDSDTVELGALLKIGNGLGAAVAHACAQAADELHDHR